MTSSLQGTSVGLSADGNTAIVGAPGDNLSIGAAWVYTRSGNAWSKQAKLVDQGVAGIKDQGRSVALSADGNTAIVGGPGDLARSIGAASVYARSGGVWSQQGSKLVGTGAVGNSAQGFCVALSADGNTAAAGGYIDNNFVGAVWLYTRSDGVWSQQGGKLVGTSVVGDSQQCNVALNADGSKVIVGGGGDNNGVGAMWVYTRSVGMWNQQGGKLIGTGGEGRTAIFEGVKRIV